MMTEQDIYYKELAMLRQELHDLKDCQVKFLTFSVTATGVLLGLAANLASTASLGSPYLFPLTILIPSWWIFFDKATTITRIVGYYRVLEKMVLESHSVKGFLGWENALAKFRELQQEGKLELRAGVKKSPVIRFIKLVVLQTTHRYWMLTYYTFLGLSALCLALSLYSGVNVTLVSVTTVMVMISAAWNAWTIWELIWGRKSYTANEGFWKDILKVIEEV